MSALAPRMFVYYAIAALIGDVQSRAVNISNTWMLPEEGFPVFYRYFRDRISWYEADAVCQFHHANLVTADSSSQYDAIRAYLKELDIAEKVWIGLSKPQEKQKFQWTNFQPLSGEGHWQESIPAGDGQSLCAVMDPSADFLWRPLPCGGPEVAAFICELPIPSWATGSKGCLLTELPSLTVLYIPEQSALELTSDCGLDGTKRIACKGSADREEMLRQLTCLISNDDIDAEEKSVSTKTSSSTLSDYSFVETSTLDENSEEAGKTVNTINSDYGLPTRYRRETEDTLSPVASTESSFKEDFASSHQDKIVLTTQHAVDIHVTPTSATNFETENLPSSTNVSPTGLKKADESTKFAVVIESTSTEITPADQETITTPRTAQVTLQTLKTVNEATATGHPENAEDYPGVINQGQLFSIIENGTMFDIIDLNETLQESTSKTELPTKQPPPTKKPLLPTKKITTKKQNSIVKLLPTKQPQSVDELEENLTKEFEMMPDIKDTSPKLNRTFRKELPMVDEHDDLENGGQFGVPRVLNLTINNNIDEDDSTTHKTSIGAVDPRLYILNTHPAQNNHTLNKEDFLPKPLLGESSGENSSEPEHPFPSDEPKKINRHRNLHNIKGRKFYPYFFSRMLG
ncbi:unnamed protein product [Ceutorhynchus assimilis]|uniref:C-type lectin domain-containing protein n=1 Tax=Ceutorhynchus assimilis TaxID=467358 RepID=A0A9P0GRL6_9CUCU|nr:unnamed protein product [Ceutorhynchus assimilis]